MNIQKLTINLCETFKEEIPQIIYNSMNFNCEKEWFSIEKSVSKFEELKKHLLKNDAICFVAINDSKIVGFIWAYQFPDREDVNRVYISILYVNEDSRGCSIGRKLIKAIENDIRKMGYRRIWLHTNGSNVCAQKFYEKVGFNKERIQYVKDL